MKVNGSGGVPIGGIIATVTHSKDTITINSNEYNKTANPINNMSHNKMQKLQLVKTRSSAGGPHDLSHTDMDYDLDYGLDPLALSSPSMRASSPSSELRLEKQRFHRTNTYPSKSNNPGNPPCSTIRYVPMDTLLCKFYIL